MKITYRMSDISDWNELTAFRNKYSKAQEELDRKHFQQDFEDSEEKNRGPLFVATFKNHIVGYGRCGFFDSLSGRAIYGLTDEAPKGYYLKGVLTDESVRGMGVGKHLTRLRNDWVKERADRIYCILQSTNLPSLKMHEALGYKIIKRDLRYQNIENDRSGLLLELQF